MLIIKSVHLISVQSWTYLTFLSVKHIKLRDSKDSAECEVAD